MSLKRENTGSDGNGRETKKTKTNGKFLIAFSAIKNGIQQMHGSYQRKTIYFITAILLS